MALLAGTLINTVRDIIGDPVYSGTGVPQPDFDGQIRAQTMYRWLDDAVKFMAGTCKFLVQDWTAVPALANQSSYALDLAWHGVDDAYARQLQCRLVKEALAIYPGRGTQSQARDAYVHLVTDHLEIGFWPVPAAADASTMLGTTMDATMIGPITLSVATGFLSYGYLLIDTELIQYQNLSGATAFSLRRGAGGTTAAAHSISAVVTHCGLWVKGRRVPLTIVSSASVVEVPPAWTPVLQLYVIAQARLFQSKAPESTAAMQAFTAACQMIAQQKAVTLPEDRQHAAAEGREVEPPGVPVTEPGQTQAQGMPAGMLG